MTSEQDEWQRDDLMSQQSMVLVYGIMASVFGLGTAVFAFLCMGCNFPAPFAVLFGAMAVHRARQVMPPLARLNAPNSSATAGLVTGIIGLCLGLFGLLLMLFVGLFMALYIGAIAAAVFFS
jgi:hypothetical protein